MLSFKKIVESLQQEEENQNFLILIRCGVFFVGIGKDAVILAEKLGLTNICFTEGVCKCGIPVNRMDKMLRKIIDNDISVVIYEYSPKGLENSSEKYKLLRRIVMKPVEESRRCLNCEKCIYYDKRVKSSIASTEDIIEGIDKILSEKGRIVSIKDINTKWKNKN